MLVWRPPSAPGTVLESCHLVIDFVFQGFSKLLWFAELFGLLHRLHDKPYPFGSFCEQIWSSVGIFGHLLGDREAIWGSVELTESFI